MVLGRWTAFTPTNQQIDQQTLLIIFTFRIIHLDPKKNRLTLISFYTTLRSISNLPSHLSSQTIVVSCTTRRTTQSHRCCQHCSTNQSSDHGTLSQITHTLPVKSPSQISLSNHTLPVTYLSQTNTTNCLPSPGQTSGQQTM